MTRPSITQCLLSLVWGHLDEGLLHGNSHLGVPNQKGVKWEMLALYV